MSISRRKFMMLAGGGVILAAGAASAGFLKTRMPHKAIEPWLSAGMYDEPRKKALSYAILAPNPHNRQPWIADLREANKVILTVDTDKLLKETDPYDRQITVGLGCFLELLVQAGGEFGYDIDIETFPLGMHSSVLDNRPIAIAHFRQNKRGTTDPLFQFVSQRRSCKEPFDTERGIDSEVLKALSNTKQSDVAINTTNDPNTVEWLRSLTYDAFEREYVTPAKLKESIDLMRFGKCEIEANPDGIDLGGPFLESLMLFGVLNPESLTDPHSEGYKQGLSMYREICSTAQGYVWLTTPGNTRVEQIMSGRAWVRVNLAATSKGLSIHPLSQALQEYPEMKSFYDSIHEKLADRGETIQMLGRLGYAADIPQSPRWGLEEKIIDV